MDKNNEVNDVNVDLNSAAEAANQLGKQFFAFMRVANAIKDMSNLENARKSFNDSAAKAKANLLNTVNELEATLNKVSKAKEALAEAEAQVQETISKGQAEYDEIIANARVLAGDIVQAAHDTARQIADDSEKARAKHNKKIAEWRKTEDQVRASLDQAVEEFDSFLKRIGK